MPQEAWAQYTTPPQQHHTSSPPPHTDNDEHMDTPPQAPSQQADIEYLQQRNQAMQKELDENANERHHAKIEMENFERQANVNLVEEKDNV